MCAARACRETRCSRLWAVWDLPAPQFIQERLVADVELPGRLFAVPFHLLQGSQYQLPLRPLGSLRSDLAKGVRLFRTGMSVGLTCNLEVGQRQV